MLEKGVGEDVRSFVRQSVGCFRPLSIGILFLLRCWGAPPFVRS